MPPLVAAAGAIGSMLAPTAGVLGSIGGAIGSGLGAAGTALGSGLGTLGGMLGGAGEYALSGAIPHALEGVTVPLGNFMGTSLGGKVAEKYLLPNDAYESQKKLLDYQNTMSTNTLNRNETEAAKQRMMNMLGGRQNNSFWSTYQQPTNNDQTSLLRMLGGKYNANV